MKQTIDEILKAKDIEDKLNEIEYKKEMEKEALSDKKLEAIEYILLKTKGYVFWFNFFMTFSILAVLSGVVLITITNNPIWGYLFFMLGIIFIYEIYNYKKAEKMIKQ